MATISPEIQAAAAAFNKDELGAKARVHDIAKKLGIRASELVTILTEQGIEGKKTASSLTREEIIGVIDTLAGQPAESAQLQEESSSRSWEESEEEEAPVKAPKKRARKRATKKKAEKEPEERIEEQPPVEQPAQEQPTVELPPEDKEPEAEELKDEAPRPAVRRVRRVVRRVGSRSQERKAAEQAPEPELTPQHTAGKAPEELHPAEREEKDVPDEPVRLKGSTRLESQRRWRAENRERTHTVSRSEFLARRESVERLMVVRDSHRHDGAGLTTQVGVVEDGMLVEHFVTSETQQSMVGNIYLGRVQNVLASMEAAFIDIGTGRNAVLYAGEMNWRSPHLHSKNRRIDSALKAGDQILVQVIKDPLGHKGARLTNRISFAGRFLVYFPGGTTAGISRKLPEGERKRLKDILSRVIPGEGGAIIRTAAENVPEEHIAEDVERLHSLWENISRREEHERNSKGAKPVTLYEEPNMLVKVVRDLFNEDFKQLIVEGDASWQTVRDYTGRMAPELKDRVVKWDPHKHDDEDVFAAYELDEQLAKALSRKVWLPSGGYLIIEPTEAMTVIDVNTGSFVGAGGNLEETVTQNNLEAAEEIVRQMRLRDLGGMIVVDFIDMVLEENQDLLLRRLTEFLGRDRTRHKVSEVTSLGLVQITRKRLGTGLLETFATTCEACEGRGFIIHEDPVEQDFSEVERRDHGGRKERQQAKREKRRREEKQEPETKQEPQQPQQPQQRSRRRVRRVVRRGNVRTPEQSQEKTKSYEEAKRAFEESPRRKRRTRGNSRSDVPPRPEDFEERPAEPKGGRRRRRVVRRSN